MSVDYLILGSGLSSLSFGALMAKAGRKVVILEAHDLPGGYGHTFIEKNVNCEYHFNAQLHYVWDCGEGEPVNLVLKKLGLDKEVEFVRYNEDGFDHMVVPGYKVTIPNSYEKLTERLATLFPDHAKNIAKFLETTKRLATLISKLKSPPGASPLRYMSQNLLSAELLLYYNKSLQQVFDKFELPLAAQSLLASQWPDFLLPPAQLSIYCWVVLFDGYMRGAYYPKKHFEHVVNSLVKLIENNGGQIIYNQTVTKFLRDKKRITGVIARDTTNPNILTEYNGKSVVCNFDPKLAASMIGFEHFSPKLRKQLDYEYSYSNFMVYGAVRGLDLRQHNFGSWNIFHSQQLDLNKAFNDMYELGDYSQLAFGMSAPSLVTDDPTGCPEGEQIFELITVANYSLFRHLKYRSAKEYNQFKTKIFNAMLDVIEEKYVPNFREHICFKMLGSPTTNASYCWSPEGNSYGANMTPKNMGLGKIGFTTSFDNFYFCNATAGSAGFARSFHNGAVLYEYLSGESVVSI